MPIYEYLCSACGHEFEALQKISEDPLKDCPQCQASALKKKVSTAAFRLKGGGWYETDFKTGDKKKNLAGDQARESGKSKSEEGGTSGGAKDKSTSAKEKKGGGGDASASAAG